MGGERRAGLVFTVAGALGLSGHGAQIDDRAFGGPQSRLVAAMLLVDRGRGWSAGELAAQLWPSGPPERWRTAVRGLVSRLRRLLVDLGLEGAVITNRSGYYHVELGELVVDVEVAHDRVVAATRALDDGEHAAAGELAGRARTVLSRPILAGLDAPWVEQLRRQVRADHLEAMLLLGRARRGQGRWAAARSVLGEVLGLAPVREDAWRELMQVETSAGNAAAALRVYEDCRRLLADELGVDPSSDTQALHTRILQAVPAPSDRRDEPVGGRSLHALGDDPDGMPAGDGRGGQRPPYVGLRPFQQADAGRFFGRDAAVQRLVDLLDDHGVVTVVGPSGSGKSSLVRAGLLPAVTGGAIADADTWRLAVMVPGRRPLEALVNTMLGLADAWEDRAAAADLVDRLSEDPGVLHDEVLRLLVAIEADPVARILLVVDQAEELFTVAEPGQATAMLAALAAALRPRVPRLVVVATLRADFYDRAATNPDMASLLSRSQLVIPPMSGAELEAAIVGPARLAGATLEGGIVGRFLDDARRQPGRLPLLQHTLWELWHHRDGTKLTVASYDEVGGIAGALARHAEQVWRTIGDQALGRRILLRGVSPGAEEQADTRRPIRRSDLAGTADPDEVDVVLERLVSSRLLRAEAGDDDTVFELAHEALLTQWPRLREWVSEQRAHLVTARQLGRAADRWAGADRDREWLLRGRTLADVVALLEVVEDGELDVVLSPDELALVAASRQARARRRAGRRVERALATGRLELAEDPEAALLLGLAVAEDVTALVPGQRDALARLLHRGIHEHRLVRRYRGVGALLAVSPDGELFATGGAGLAGGGDPSEVWLNRVDTGEVVATLGGHDPAMGPRAAFTPDGRGLVSGDATGTLRSWDLATGRPEAFWAGPDGPVGGIDVAAGSGLVAAWFAIERSRRVVVFSGDGTPVHTYAPDDATVEHLGPARGDRLVAFDPTGNHLLVAIADGACQLDLIDVNTWEVVASASRPRAAGATLTMNTEVFSLEWSPDGEAVAVSVGGATQIHRGASLELLRSAPSPTYSSVAWTGDGQRVSTSGSTLMFLDRDPPGVGNAAWTPPVLVRPTAGYAEDSHMRGVAHSDHVLVGSWTTSSVDLQDVSTTGSAEIAKLEPTVRKGLAWSPDGTRLAVGRDAGVVAVVDTDTWEPVERYGAHPHDREDARRFPRTDGGIAWAPDGTFLASTANDQTVTIRPFGGGRDVTRFVGPGDAYYGTCQVTPDSRHVVVVFGGRAHVLRPDGTIVATLEFAGMSQVGGVALSPDGALLAISLSRASGRRAPGTSGAPRVDVWDWQAGRIVQRFAVGDDKGAHLSFHPEGRWLAATVADERAIQLVDVNDGHLLHELRRDGVKPLDVVHHHGGHLLASSGHDQAVRIWDLDRMEQVAFFDAFTGQPGQMAFHPTRPWLAVVDWSGVVRVWTHDLDELVEIARARVTRDLSDGKRRLLDD